MFARLVLLLLALASTGSAQASIWYLQGHGNVTGSFEYTEAGGYTALNLFAGPTSIPLFIGGDANFLQAAFEEFPNPRLTLKFVEPLTDLGGTVAVAPFPESNFLLFPPDCFPTSFCLDSGIESVTTTAPAPLPSTALLTLVALGGLRVLRRPRC